MLAISVSQALLLKDLPQMPITVLVQQGNSVWLELLSPQIALLELTQQ